MMTMRAVAPKAYADGIPVWCAHDAIVDVVSLVPNPRNPNKHPDAQIELGARIIKAHGWRWPIAVSKRSGFITKGHGRLLFAQKLGVKEVPVDYQDYENEAAEWQDVLADNKLQEFAEPDLDLVRDILESVEELDASLTGYDPKDLLSVDIPEDDGFAGNYDDVETDIQVGQVFSLGRHRLMCGDATNKDHIMQLLDGLDGATPELLFTDPPYEFDVTRLYDIFDHINIKHILMMAGFQQIVDLIRYDKLRPRLDLIYVRKHITSSIRTIQSAPHYKHIQVIYFTRGDHKSIFDRRLARGAVSDAAYFPSVIEEEEHVDKKVFGYGKDLRAICKIMSAFEFSTMLDLFGGSGTFLIACEEMGKTCYCMELDPKNCQLIINRWEENTGKKAQALCSATS